MNHRWILGGLGLIALAVLGRLIPHAANLTPLYAVALFACAVFPKRWAIAVPVAAMAISDLVIGMHATVLFTWSGMLVFAALGYGLREGRTAWRIVGSALAGSVLFFLWTNFGHWLTMGMYPMNGAGLLACYAAGLPFFRNSALGNVAFVSAMFAAYEWYRVRRAARLTQAAAV